MLISDVEAITGLSRKSIRLYEAKGLLSAKRAENSYRYFDEQTVEKLKCIAVLRRVGIPIADIQLWQSGVISAEEKVQDAGRLLERAQRLLDFLVDKFSPVEAIGITGQMHGIVYSSGDKVLSPLYTWQDQRASAEFCRELMMLSGYGVAPGYGLATHIFLKRAGQMPEGAKCISTIMDFFAAKLCGLDTPVMHATNAASLGFYDLCSNRFDADALERCGAFAGILPAVTAGCEVIGSYRGIPVAVAIGDNQASFLGAVKDQERSALANFGTGSQISLSRKTKASALHSASVTTARRLATRKW